jgi:hypothetical protein
MFANGEVEMSAAQVQAAKVVIGKEIPDLKALEVSGDEDMPLKMLIGWMEHSK